MYRRSENGLEVFLVHPGGPFYHRKDLGVWSVPKGEYVDGEDPLEHARREFEEETGQSVAACATGVAPMTPLGAIQQKSGKVVTAWAFEGEWPASAMLHSNRFTIEWPPGSGKQAEFPEVDRAEFFSLEIARQRILAAQSELLDRLLARLADSERGGPCR